jgi:hypothetical protein
MFKKLTSLAMAAVMMAGLSLGAVQPAQARDGRGVGVGIAAGIIGLGILGAAASARGDGYQRSSCYKGREECAWSDRHCFENRYGDTVCRGGVYRCYRPTICD